MNQSRILLRIAALTSALFVHSLGTTASAWQDPKPTAVRFPTFKDFARVLQGLDLDRWNVVMDADGSVMVSLKEEPPKMPAPPPVPVVCPCCSTKLGGGGSYLCPPPVYLQPVQVISGGVIYISPQLQAAGASGQPQPNVQGAAAQAPAPTPLIKSGPALSPSADGSPKTAPGKASPATGSAPVIVPRPGVPEAQGAPPPGDSAGASTSSGIRNPTVLR